MKTCFMIPNYNHGNTILKTIELLSQFDLPCVVVDDGSTDDSYQKLTHAQSANPQLMVYRLTENQGKGAASVHGFRKAQEQGFTHALQIDADLQHNFADIKKFLAASKANPKALISGKPVYDETVPKERLYGRKFCHIWVNLEIWGTDIQDAMCGFRVYPIAATLAVADKCNLGTRMDFDIDVLVRLFWDNVPMQFIDTPVIYPEDGVSHFKLFRDNVIITKMHIKLIFLMFTKIPFLIKKRFLSG